MAHANYLESLRFLCNLDNLVAESDEEVSRLWADRRLPLVLTSDYHACWSHFPDDTGEFVDQHGTQFRVEIQPHLKSECAVTYQLESTIRSIPMTYPALIVAKITWSTFLKIQTAEEQQRPPEVQRQAFIDRFLSKVPRDWREVILIGDLHLRDDSMSPRPCDEFKLPDIYKPLNPPQNIRVITIHPALETHESIRCSLREAELNSDTKFEALSYVWGNPAARNDIFINEQRFSVTTNLFFALQSLRLRDSDRVMWIDAVCINQSDIAERESQVAQMDDVYSQATEVVLWLGSETTTSSKAFTHLIGTMRRNGALTATAAPTWADVELPLASIYCGSDNLLTPQEESDFLTRHENSPDLRQSITDVVRDFNSALLSTPPSEFRNDLLTTLTEYAEAYLELLRRPHWERTWVLQEVILANKVTLQCGRQSTDWKHFLDMVLRIQRAHKRYCFGYRVIGRSYFLMLRLHQQLNQVFPFMFLSRASLSAEKPAPESLACFLSMTANSQATNPRDKVYGLLGMLERESTARKQLPPIYTQSSKRLFIAVARYFLDTTKTLDVLTARSSGIHGNTSGDVRGLPSWVPDWTAIHDLYDNPISLGIFSNFVTRGLFRELQSEDVVRSHTPFFRAGLDADSEHTHSFSQFGETFNVDGLEVGRVAFVLPRFHDSTALSLWNDAWRSFKQGGVNMEPGRVDLIPLFLRSYEARWKACQSKCGEVYRHTGQPLQDAFWRTMFLDRFYDTFGSPPKLARFPSSGEPFEASKLFNYPIRTTKHRDGLLDCPFPPQTLEHREKILDFMMMQNTDGLLLFATEFHCLALSFIITENGWIGIGHPQAAVGDTVAVLYGGSVPYILHEYPEGHNLVGEW